MRPKQPQQRRISHIPGENSHTHTSHTKNYIRLTRISLFTTTVFVVPSILVSCFGSYFSSFSDESLLIRFCQFLISDKKPPSRRLQWVIPNIRIRILSKVLGRGRFYCKKGRVEDVPSPYQFMVVMDTGETLNGIDCALRSFVSMDRRVCCWCPLCGRHCVDTCCHACQHSTIDNGTLAERDTLYHQHDTTMLTQQTRGAVYNTMFTTFT